jgi:hypothetical protein
MPPLCGFFHLEDCLMTKNSENRDPMAQVSGAIRVPRAVEEANSYLRGYVERMQEEADGYRHGDRRWTIISSFDPRLWPPARPQPDESKLLEDEIGLIRMARARYEELSDDAKSQDLSQMWASEGDLRPAGVALEAAGRGADDRLVHAATGEMVVPRQLMTNDPWLRSYLARVFEAAGLDWRKHVVGGPNRINPATGLAEFDPFGERDEPDEGIGGGGYSPDGSGGSDGLDNSGGENRGWNSNLSARGAPVRNELVRLASLTDVPGIAATAQPASAQSTPVRSGQMRSAWGDDFLSTAFAPTGSPASTPKPASEFGLLDGDPYPNYDEESLGRAIRDGRFSRASSFGVNTDWNPFDYTADPYKWEQETLDTSRALFDGLDKKRAWYRENNIPFPTVVKPGSEDLSPPGGKITNESVNERAKNLPNPPADGELAAGGIQVVATEEEASLVNIENELKAAWDALEALWGKPSPHWDDLTGKWVYD